MLRRATHEEEDDTRFGGAVTDRIGGILFGGLHPAAKELGERQSQCAKAADTENLAARDAIAQPGAAAVNAQHRVGPCKEASTLFYQIGRGSRMNLLPKHDVPRFYVGQVDSPHAKLAHDILNDWPTLAELLPLFFAPILHDFFRKIWRFIEVSTREIEHKGGETISISMTQRSSSQFHSFGTLNSSIRETAFSRSRR
jgi:hypothetical protein